MKRRNSIITLLLTLSMVFSTSAFAVFADTTDQEEQIVKDTPATEEVVNETPEEPAAVTEQAEDVQEQGIEAVEPAGELKPAEEPTAEVKYESGIYINAETKGSEDYFDDTAKYDAATKTLTLNGFNRDYIYFNGVNLNIVLQGNNIVNGGIIEVEGWSSKLVLSGNGSLTIAGKDRDYYSGGIHAHAVDINGGNISIKNVRRGIIATNVVISGGNIKVSASGSPLLSSKKISFSGDVYADIEIKKPQGDLGTGGISEVPAVCSYEKDGITLSDDLQIVLPENGKVASYKPEARPTQVDEYTTIVDASGNPAKHVIIDRVKNPSGMLLAKAVAKGKTNMAISWTAMNDVDGYDVYFARCNTKSKKFAPELVASVDKGTTSYTVSGLKKGTAYKAYVQAYIMKSGAKQYVGKSLSTHAYAGGSSKKYTNPKSVKVKKAKVSIKKGKTYKINASVRKLKKSKKLISTEHAKKLRYLSSNTSIATVSKKGKIKAVTPGTCTVYAIAANGVYKTVSVTVK